MGNIAAPVQFPAKSVDRTILAACAGYALLLVAFWFVARHFAMEDRIHGHMASSFTAFALLLAPYWFFGFGAAEMLQRFLSNRAVRVLVAGLLLVPYLIFAVPRGEFLWTSAVVLFSIPVAIAALFEFLHWHFDTPEEAFPTSLLPESTARKVMAENARTFYRLG